MHLRRTLGGRHICLPLLALVVLTVSGAFPPLSQAAVAVPLAPVDGHGGPAASPFVEVSSSPRSAIGTSHAVVARSGLTPAAISPISIYGSEPAPMGIADMGVGAGGVAYSYTTPMLLSNISFLSQNIYNNSLKDGGADLYTWQMNAFLGFTEGSLTLYYWIQDVATMDTTTRELQFMDCVWNATTSSAEMKTSGTVTGNGSVSGGVYSDDSSSAPGATVTTATAASFRMIIESALSSTGEPVVYLGYEDQATPGYYQDFDTVTFVSAKHITSDENFVVNGNSYNVWGTAYDAEIMVGGPFNGDFTVAHATTDMSMQIYRWNGHNFEAPQATWNFGSETAESISDAQTFFSNDGNGEPEDTIWNGTAHNATTGALYDQYQVGALSLSAPSLTTGTVAVGTDVTPFQNGMAFLTLDPGTYHVWVNSSSGTNDLGMCTIAPGVNVSVSVPGTCSGGGSGPTITSFSLSPNPVISGNTESMTVAASGGTSPLSYSYTGLPSGCSNSNSDPLVCAPTATGTFMVTATVTDAHGLTASASAVLTVNPVPPAPLKITGFSANPQNVSLEWATTLSVTTTGGTAPLAYAYTHLPPGCTSTDASADTCNPTASGHYNATVEVIDSSTPAQHAWANASFWVEPAPPPLVITSFSATPNPVVVGSKTVLNVSTTGGDGWPAYVYTGLPPGCTSEVTWNLACTPTATGVYEVEVNASISSSSYANARLNLTVVPPLAITSFTASPNPVFAGAESVLTVTTAGGAGTPTYTYHGLPPGCVGSSVSSLDCTPSTAGTYPIDVNASISASSFAIKWLNLTVEAVPPPIPPLTLDSFSANRSTFLLGGSVELTAIGGGGVKPYVFTYWANGTGCSFGSSGNNSCTPTTAGTFTAVVVLTDAQGASVHASLTFTVATPPPSGSTSGTPLGLSTLDWVAVGAVVVLAVALVAVLAARRRRPPEEESSPWPPPFPPPPS